MTHVHARSPPARFRVPGHDHDPARNRPRARSGRGRGALPPLALAPAAAPRAAQAAVICEIDRRAPQRGLRPVAADARLTRAARALRALDGPPRLLLARRPGGATLPTACARPATAAAGSRPVRRSPGRGPARDAARRRPRLDGQPAAPRVLLCRGYRDVGIGVALGDPHGGALERDVRRRLGAVGEHAHPRCCTVARVREERRARPAEPLRRRSEAASPMMQTIAVATWPTGSSSGACWRS